MPCPQWGQPWQIIQDKRDHCILHYEKGIMAACKANKAAEKRLCAADPHGNNVCSLKRGFRDPATPGDALPHQALHKVRVCPTLFFQTSSAGLACSGCCIQSRQLECYVVLYCLAG